MRWLKRFAIVLVVLFATFVLVAVGTGFLRGWQQRRAELAAGPATGPATTGQSRELWLGTLRPLELEGQCTDSPVARSFAGKPAECRTAVAALFDRCTTRVLAIPQTIASRSEAVRFGARIGECIAAHHFGGEHLRLFRLAEAADPATSR